MSKLAFFEGSQSEEVLLRCTLIYNKVRQRISRDDIVEKAIYASVALSNASLDIERLFPIVHNNYHCLLEVDEIRKKLDNLRDARLIKHDNYTGIRLSNEANIDEHISGIETCSENLISCIYAKTETIYRKPIPNPQQVRLCIRRAITAYLRETFLELFDLQKVKQKDQRENIIKETINGFGNEIGGSIIRALSDILLNPNDEQKQVLQDWSKAFLTLQIMDLDPKLNEFKLTKFKNKAFVIDTDVALHCLCENTRSSRSYKALIKALRDINCKLYLPELVINEIHDHIDAAIKKARFLGDSLLELSDELLEQGEHSNAFIEDYVKTARIDITNGEEVMPFDIYIENIRLEKDPSLLRRNLIDIFGRDNIERPFEIPLNKTKEIEELTEAIHKKTVQTPKAERRSDEKNREISRTDAILYLTVKEMNDEGDNDKFFSNKTYILTRSSRSKRCAIEIDGYQRKIICNPLSLCALLEETGAINNNETDFIELLENPYMSYVADQLWAQIEPIILQHHEIKFKTINALKSNVNIDLDKILTSQSIEEKVRLLRQLEPDDPFGKELKMLKQELEEALEKIEELSATNEAKDQLLSKKDRNRLAYWEKKTKGKKKKH